METIVFDSKADVENEEDEFGICANYEHRFTAEIIFEIVKFVDKFVYYYFYKLDDDLKFF